LLCSYLVAGQKSRAVRGCRQVISSTTHYICNIGSHAMRLPMGKLTEFFGTVACMNLPTSPSSSVTMTGLKTREHRQAVLSQCCGFHSARSVSWTAKPDSKPLVCFSSLSAAPTHFLQVLQLLVLVLCSGPSHAGSYCAGCCRLQQVQSKVSIL